MAEPTSKTTRSKRGMRRSHHAIKGMIFATCQNCGMAIKPHHFCSHCGFYKGRFYAEMVKTPRAKKKKQDQDQDQNQSQN